MESICNAMFKLIHYEMAHSEARINIVWNVWPLLKNGSQIHFLNGFINT